MVCLRPYIISFWRLDKGYVCFSATSDLCISVKTNHTLDVTFRTEGIP